MRVPAGKSLLLAGTCLKVSGASATASAGKARARIAECGQTNTHLPHWVHRSSIPLGISSAMLRFSNLAVPVGKLPSTGIADTGRRLPSPR
jgi:hypothetical protein